MHVCNRLCLQFCVLACERSEGEDSEDSEGECSAVRVSTVRAVRVNVEFSEGESACSENRPHQREERVSCRELAEERNKSGSIVSGESESESNKSGSNEGECGCREMAPASCSSLAARLVDRSATLSSRSLSLAQSLLSASFSSIFAANCCSNRPVSSNPTSWAVNTWSIHSQYSQHIVNI